jgi:hypothetical protein
LWLPDHTQSPALFEEEPQIEASEGILLPNGSRRQIPAVSSSTSPRPEIRKKSIPGSVQLLQGHHLNVDASQPDVLSWYTRGAVNWDRCSYLGEYSGKEIRKGE